ncbi:MAG: alpha/beta hydrolase, partial [Chloroflexota bacterium]
DLLLDIYLPDDGGGRTRPVVVFIHGGGFQTGSKEGKIPRTMLGYFVERGFVGMSINYRLLDDYATYPAEINAVIDSFSGITEKQQQQARAMYGANRDAKAAIRWIYANAAEYNIDTNHITVIGGSAGSNISIALGVTNPEDYRDELSLEEDPTLASTHLEYDSTVHTVIDHWGGPTSVMLLEETYAVDRWDGRDAPIHIVHGTNDRTVPFSQAEQIVERYEENGIPYALHPLEGAGHGAWQAEVDGKRLPELAFDFVIQVQELPVIEH